MSAALVSQPCCTSSGLICVMVPRLPVATCVCWSLSMRDRPKSDTLQMKPRGSLRAALSSTFCGEEEGERESDGWESDGWACLLWAGEALGGRRLNNALLLSLHKHKRLAVAPHMRPMPQPTRLKLWSPAASGRHE